MPDLDVSNDTLIWCDTETFGLDPDTGPPIEWQWFATTPTGDITSSHSSLLWSDVHDDYFQALPSDAWTIKQHTDSGLWKAAKAHGVDPEKALEQLIPWLMYVQEENVEKSPLCGNSIHFDRLHLSYWCSEVLEHLSYRNIDISTTKEQCRRLNPRLYNQLKKLQPSKEDKPHRAHEDLIATLEEYKFYQDNLLFIP